jgi:arylsulfatase A-like enzyme
VKGRLSAAAVAGLAAGALAGLLGGGCRKPAPPRPNIVVVVWDTTRVDALSAYGYRRPTTPRLEKFAAGGTKYLNAFSPAPWTAPAHASLFTGLAMFRHGLEVGRGDRMRRGIPTLAQTLCAAGYRTACFTANGYISGTTGLSAGFTEYHQVYKENAAENNDAEAVRACVASWLEGLKEDPAKGAPWFIFMNLMDCHQPLRPPPLDVVAVKDDSVSREDLAKANSVIQSDFLEHLMGTKVIDASTFRGLRARYDAAALFQDRKTGEILDLLEARGLLRDALVAVTADHGEQLGEHGLVDHRLSLYEPLLHVPLVVRWPGKFPAGLSVERSVSLMDLYPTILDAAGVPVPEGNGLDAVPLPRRAGASGGRTLLAEFARPLAHIEEMRQHFPQAPAEKFHVLSVAIASARDPVDAPRPLKYIRYTRGGEDGGKESLAREELFEIGKDPGERNDLLRSGDPAGRAEADRLGKAIDAMRKGGPR